MKRGFPRGVVALTALAVLASGCSSEPTKKQPKNEVSRSASAAKTEQPLVSVSASDEALGVKVDALVEASTSVRIDEDASVPKKSGDPAGLGFSLLRPAAKVELANGEQPAAGTKVAFTVPEGVNPDDAFVVRWTNGQWVPQGQVVEGSTVAAYTDRFSTWSLATFNDPKASKKEELQSEVANSFLERSSFFAYISRLASRPPTVAGCTSELKTFKVDVSAFYPAFTTAGAVCVKAGDAPDTYTLSVGNTAGFPVVLSLPKGVTPVGVSPGRGNLLSQLVEMARESGVEPKATLGNGQRITLKVDAGMSSPAVVSADIDFGGMLIESAGEVLSTVIPLNKMAINRAAVRAMGKEKVRTYSKLAGMLKCVSSQSVSLAKTARSTRARIEASGFAGGESTLAIADFAAAFTRSVSACTMPFVQALMAVVTDPLQWGIDRAEASVTHAVKNRLQSLVGQRFRFIVSAWNLGANFSELFRALWQALYKDSGSLEPKQLTLTKVAFEPWKEGKRPPLWCMLDDPDRRALYGNPPRYWFDPCRRDTLKDTSEENLKRLWKQYQELYG